MFDNYCLQFTSKYHQVSTDNRGIRCLERPRGVELIVDSYIKDACDLLDRLLRKFLVSPWISETVQGREPGTPMVILPKYFGLDFTFVSFDRLRS